MSASRGRTAAARMPSAPTRREATTALAWAAHLHLDWLALVGGWMVQVNREELGPGNADCLGDSRNHCLIRAGEPDSIESLVLGLRT